jgi:hypothetical protein
MTFDGSLLTLGGGTQINAGGGTFQWFNDNTFFAGQGDLTSTGAVVNMGSSQVNDFSNFSSWDTDIYYNGLVVGRCTFTSAGSFSKGQLVYQRDDGTWALADADTNISIRLLGIALDSGVADDPLAVLLNGIYSTAYHNQSGTSKPGQPLYISPTTGNVTETAPTTSGQYVRLIGHNIAEGTDVVVVRFDPDCTWIEL